MKSPDRSAPSKGEVAEFVGNKHSTCMIIITYLYSLLYDFSRTFDFFFGHQSTRWIFSRSPSLLFSSLMFQHLGCQNPKRPCMYGLYSTDSLNRDLRLFLSPCIMFLGTFRVALPFTTVTCGITRIFIFKNGQHVGGRILLYAALLMVEGRGSRKFVTH